MFKKFKATIDALEGDIAEVGVYQGGSALKLVRTFPNKTIHLFDTFSGMPKTDPSIDDHKQGDFGNTSLEKVKEKLKEHKDIYYYPGIFPQTTGLVVDCKFALVNIDVDIYRSTKDCLDFFWPRTVKGGILLIQDDYGFPDCRGVTKAVNEFVKNKGVELITGTQHAWIVKVEK